MLPLFVVSPIVPHLHKATISRRKVTLFASKATLCAVKVTLSEAKATVSGVFPQDSVRCVNPLAEAKRLWGKAGMGLNLAAAGTTMAP